MDRHLPAVGEALSRAPGYRADIDGLRAIAVLGVVLYHFQFPGIPGGFLGVDIFFVISGFLITRLIGEELETTGQLRFGRFYLRRMRRLFPALAATVLASGIAAVLLLSPVHLIGFAAESAAALLSVSNILFFRESGYFDVAASYKPLLHTWSLGVEEQFYLVWPLLAFASARLALPLRVAMLLAGALATLVAAELLHDRDAAFYLMPLRIFEFAAGAALIWVEDRKPQGFPAEVMLAAGLGAIAASFCLLSSDSRLPGVLTLIPVAGSVLAIQAGRARIAGTVLRHPVTVWVGRISYSLYLVHWPLLIFTHYGRNTPLGAWEGTGLLAASLVLATLMVRFVETPFRFPGPARNNRRFLAGCAAAAALCLAASAAFLLDDGWSWRLSPEEARLVASSSREVDLNGACHYDSQAIDAALQQRFDACVETAGKAVLIFGDSHGINLFKALAHNGARPHVAGVVKGGCRPVRPNANCYFDALPDFIRRNRAKLDGVVFTQKGSYFLTRYRTLPVVDVTVRATVDYLDEVAAAGVPLLWVGPQWEPNFDVANAVAAMPEPGTFLYLSADNVGGIGGADARIRQIVAERPHNFTYLSRIGLLGPLTEDEFVMDGEYAYKDTNHWSAKGEEVFGRRLLERSPELRALLGLRQG